MKKFIITAVLASAVFLTACQPSGASSDSKTSDDNVNNPIASAAGNGFQGYNAWGNFFQTEGISMTFTSSSPSLYFSSGWDEDGMSVICTDPLCAHDSSSCSAYASSMDSFSFINGGKRIIIEGQDSDVTGSGNEITVEESSIVYEADMDGSNRRKLTDFDARLWVTTYTSVIYGRTLYFYAENKSVQTSRGSGEIDEITGGTILNVESVEDWSVYGMNLDTYEIQKFFTVHSSKGPYCGLFYDDLGLYAYIDDSDNNIGYYDKKLYMLKKDGAETIYESSQNIQIIGVLDQKPVYIYCDAYKMPELSGIYTAGNDGEKKIIDGDYGIVLDKQIVYGETIDKSNQNMQGSLDVDFDYGSVYCFYDKDGTLLRTVEYPGEFVTFVDIVDGKLIYRLSRDNSFYYVDYGNMENLLEDGKRLYDSFEAH